MSFSVEQKRMKKPIIILGCIILRFVVNQTNQPKESLDENTR
jgi:hypothetical protein